MTATAYAPTLFDTDGPIDPQPILEPRRRANLDEHFANFHALNPNVYRALVALTRRAVASGHKVGMKAVYERLRWEWVIETQGDDFKLNNNLTSRYARLIMAQEPDLADAFVLRKLHS